MRRLAALFALVVVVSLVATSQVRAQSSAAPEEVVLAYTTPEGAAIALSEAFKQADFQRASAIMHPQALATLREMLMELASLNEEAAQALLGESDQDVLAELSDGQIFERFMDAIFSIQPGMREMLGSLETQVIGHVLEGDDLAHVVTRNHMAAMGVEMSKMQVMTVQRDGEGWRALLSGDMSGVVEAIRSGMADSEE